MSHVAAQKGSPILLPRRRGPGRGRRPSARRRLTAMFAATFLLLGAVVIVLGYLLTAHTSSISVTARPAPNARGLPALLVDPARRAQRDLLGAVVAQQHNDLRAMLAVSGVMLLFAGVASVLLGWLVSGRLLRPLRRMTETARTITATDLERRLALTGPDDEFKQLGDTLDDLLARLQHSFESQRRFVANASHELRTPLAVDRTLLQVALADSHASAQQLRAVCEEVLASGREQERLLEALLTLASSERGLERIEPVDLARIARTVLAASDSALRERSLRLVAELGPAPSSGDSALLQRMLANLVDNAIGYNRPDGTVQVRTGTGDDGGRAFVSVANDGPSIRPDEVDRLFEPFHRLGGGRSAATDGHHGLGLSIVQAIADAHGAAVVAVAREGGGLIVTVTL
ncbi:MAG: sensor histidine kinase [Solirubrobacteraceae bacterium]